MQKLGLMQQLPKAELFCLMCSSGLELYHVLCCCYEISGCLVLSFLGGYYLLYSLQVKHRDCFSALLCPCSLYWACATGKLQSHLEANSVQLEERVNITTLVTSFGAKPLISQDVVIPSETIAVPESKCFKPMSVCGFCPGNRENVMMVQGRYCLMCQLQNSSAEETAASSYVYEDLHLTMETSSSSKLSVIVYPH